VLDYGTSGEREAILSCGAYFAHSIHDHARTFALCDSDNVEYPYSAVGGFVLCTESDLLQSPILVRVTHNLSHTIPNVMEYSHHRQSPRHYDILAPFYRGIYPEITVALISCHGKFYQVSELCVLTLECRVDMILGRKKARSSYSQVKITLFATSTG
jgi:hypothetical protein